jgi:hypothetical protein
MVYSVYVERKTEAEADSAYTRKVEFWAKSLTKLQCKKCTTSVMVPDAFLPCQAALFFPATVKTSVIKHNRKQQIVIGFSFISSKRKSSFPDAVFVPETIPSHTSSIRQCSMCKEKKIVKRLLKQIKATQKV